MAPPYSNKRKRYEDWSACPMDDVSTASLDAINKIITQPLKRHQFIQPKRDAAIQKEEASIMEIMLIRRRDGRKHLPYDGKDFGNDRVLQKQDVFYKPASRIDKWVWRVLHEKVCTKN